MTETSWSRFSHMFSFDHLLLGSAILLLLSIFASKAARRLGVPSLLLFLAIGMLAGSDGISGIYFDNPKLAQSLGVLSLALILFSGGLDTDIREIRPIIWQGLSLSALGVLLTSVATACFTTFVLGFTWMESLLLGAIMSATDAAAVFTVLKSNRTGLKGSLEPLLELESGSNDPMAVFLTVALTTKIMHPELAWANLGILFVQQIVLGAVIGFSLGKLVQYAINKLKLEHEGLYPVFTLALVLFTYATAASVEGSGFLAVYLAGLVLGNGEIIHRRSLLHFHDGLAWLTQIAMFLVLGLLVFPSRLPGLFGIGTALALFLMFVARPLGVFVSLMFALLGFKEKLFVSWVGLRGSVPIVLATFPLLGGVPHADKFFHLVFFVVLISVAVQGTTLTSIARILGLTEQTHAHKHVLSEAIQAG